MKGLIKDPSPLSRGKVRRALQVNMYSTSIWGERMNTQRTNI